MAGLLPFCSSAGQLLTGFYAAVAGIDVSRIPEFFKAPVVAAALCDMDFQAPVLRAKLTDTIGIIGMRLGNILPETGRASSSGRHS